MKFIHLREYEDNDIIIMVDNIIYQVEKEGNVIVSNKDNDLITLKSVYHISSMKNFFFITNAC